jgi:hypothetical protein
MDRSMTLVCLELFLAFNTSFQHFYNVIVLQKIECQRYLLCFFYLNVSCILLKNNVKGGGAREPHGGAKRAKHRAKRSPECGDPVGGTP